MALKYRIDSYFFKKNWQPLLMILIFIAMMLISGLMLSQHVMNDNTSANDVASTTADVPPSVTQPTLAPLSQLTFLFRPERTPLKEHISDPSTNLDEGCNLFNAPLSDLNFQVTGIVNTSRQHDSLAIVRQGQKQYSLVTGEKLPTNHAKIVRIFSDRIIISRRGKYESLRMNH